jgi:hypothetical protein
MTDEFGKTMEGKRHEYAGVYGGICASGVATSFLHCRCWSDPWNRGNDRSSERSRPRNDWHRGGCSGHDTKTFLEPQTVFQEEFQL